jgi:DNA-nicking Smr family endonuclease
MRDGLLAPIQVPAPTDPSSAITLTGSRAAVTACATAIRSLIAAADIASQAAQIASAPHRHAADIHAAARAEAFTHAARAYESGRKAEAAALAAAGHALTAAVRADETAASRAAFTALHSEKTSPLHLDLHGQTVEAALALLVARVTALRAKPVAASMQLDVVTGAGHHTPGGPPAARLRPAVEEWCRQQRLAFSTDGLGVVRVSLGLS